MQVEVTLHQEPHASRGVDAAPTLVDVGLAILKVELDGSHSIVAFAERCMQQNVHLSTSLECVHATQPPPRHTPRLHPPPPHAHITL